MDVQLLLVFALICGTSGQSQGPAFLQEPPPHLTFSNTTGSQVSCSAHGSPTPQVDWLLKDGQAVTAVPGLRQSLGNGTLYFPPFRGEDYRKDVHATVYKCRASNIAGTVISRDVYVKAVVTQPYDVQVYHTHVLAGNTAVLVCVIPASIREYVTVTSWSRDDSILLPGSNMGGRMVVTYSTGELHIRNARTEDGLARYSCTTLHVLTQERKRSAPAVLTVTEPSGSMPPRLAPTVQTATVAERDSDVHLTCSAQGNPPPNFNWFQEVGGHLHPIYSSARFEPLQDVLLIRKVRLEDNGRWTCKVSNHFGEQRLDIHLTVTAHLTVHVVSEHKAINSGDNAIFNCTVSGSPVGLVQWFRNGELLVIDGNGKFKLLGPLVLMVNRVTRHDRGMYQCVVRNDRESAQGSAELRLGDTMPELQYTFIEQALRPGPHVSLRCSATGSPPPQFQWLLDGEVKSAELRYAIGQYVDQSGDVISHLNISNVRVEDGGLYSCRAVNSLGSAEHSARLNIYGPPFIRSIGPVKAVAGSDVTLHCPYSGYPIESVRWERYGQELPLDLRHRIDESGSFTIASVDQTADTGYYACSVKNREGEVARREIQIIVHSPPILEPFSFPTSLQEGGRAQVTCYVTSGDMPIHFSWYKDDAPIPSSLQVEERAAEFYSMLIFKEVSSKHSGAYTCVANNAAARANYTAHLMVKVAPQWVVEPQDVSALLGNNIMIDCAASGFPKPQITWLKGQGKSTNEYKQIMNIHGKITLLSNGSIWMENLSPHDEGYYLCSASNGIGSGLSKVIYVGVNEPARFDIPLKNVSTKRGNPVVLHCHVYGDSPIDITWTKNGNKLDLNSYRYTVSKTTTDNGLKSQVTILHADREDSGSYKCLAENSFGKSQHVINLAVQERPEPPITLKVIQIKSRSVRLSWSKPFDGNSPIIGYLVQYQPLSIGREWEQSGTLNLTLPASLDPSSNSEAAVIGALQPATAYKIRMLAVNSIDQSYFTEPLVVKTQEEEPSEAPQDVQVESVGPGELYITWKLPPRETWNGELMGYIVTWNEQGKHMNSSKTITVKGWATTKLQLTGLRKFTRYEITVRAFNSVSAGPPSATAIGITKEGVPEAPPEDIACSQISSQSMKISWTPPPVAFHGGHIQGYKIFYRPISSENDNIPTTGEVKRTASTETYLHGLYKYTNYSIKVLAFTGAGDGVMSSAIFCTTEEDVPGPPAAIKAAALSKDAILVSWLPPEKPNGRITHYSVYAREAGRVGKHKTYMVRGDGGHLSRGLTHEVHSLNEHQLYEFWVSATTSMGEGDATPMVNQATNPRAGARIISFGQVVHKAVKSRVFLPCVAVGNPPPRTLWIYRDRPITFSTFYEVTPDGHLNIHSADQSLSGNYTCTAKNLYGEDEVTYSIIVTLPPSAPTLEVQFTTAKSIRLRWMQPDDGGAPIQGYTLSAKRETNDWISIELSPEHTVYSLENLHCGSIYYIYLIAYNKVGNSSPSTLLTVTTKGGKPQLPKERDFISTNATSLQLNLYNWPDGGCSITEFSIMYRALGAQKWILVSVSASGDKLLVQDLIPATWYQLKVGAKNDAGEANGLFNFATTTLLGGVIPPPPRVLEGSTVDDGFSLLDKHFLMTIACVITLLLTSIFILWFTIRKKKSRSEEATHAEEQPHDDKTIERENRRNCQQVYTSSPIKSNEKLQDAAAATYEISPYATFSVPGNNSRSVTTSTLDYTVQFKTFGHIEEDEHSAIVYPKSSGGKHTWHKHRYYNSEGNQRVRPSRLQTNRGDSESDDTSGSPCGEFPGCGGSYRVPVKPARDLFRPDSSTESNDVSPVVERRDTPRHLVITPGGGPRRHHRATTTSSSSEEETIRREVSTDNICLQPPSGFSDSRELSEAECDRELKPRKLSVELANLLERYQERREQERKEFTIHV